MPTPKLPLLLTDAAIAEIVEAVARHSAERIARNPDALYTTLEQRRCAVGGMLELARRLNAPRLVRALEVHKNELRRQIEAL